MCNNPTLSAYTQYKSSIVMPFRNGIDLYVQSHSKGQKQTNLKIFGTLTWPLILCSGATAHIIEDINEYFIDNVISKNIPYDADDYHFHLSYIYLTQKLYVEALNEFEKIQNGVGTYQNISQWNSYTALLRKVLTNYPPTTIVNSSNPYRSLSMNQDEIVMLFNMQGSVRYWNDIGTTETAYIQCLNTLHYVSKVFEKSLRVACSRKCVTPLKNNIHSMIIALQNLFPGMAPVEGDLVTNVSKSDTPSLLVANFQRLLSRINGYQTEEERMGGLLFLCRVLRNNSSHELSLVNKIFNTKAEFIEYVSILHEGILLAGSI